MGTVLWLEDYAAEQLMSYLSQIGSMEELRYVFNDRKTNIFEARTKMQSLLQGSKKDAIFEVIWNNIPLKNSLWNPDDYPTGGITKNEALITFMDWLQNLNDKIYIIVDVN